MSKCIVSKFGGTSLADSSQLRKVLDIVRSDPRRRVIVVSAAGKRSENDRKTTDLLLHYNSFLHSGAPYAGELGVVIDRYRQIGQDLGVELSEKDLSSLYGLVGDTLVSRGEYLMAKILAHALGFVFCDASLLIYFAQDGKLDWDTTNHYCSKLVAYCGRGVVVPGFYGSMPDMSVKTFSRGGSDITGAILAASLGAAVYENWTDVAGTLMADPRVVQNPRKVESMTYQEMFELAYSGAGVLHDEAVFPVRKAGIPIHIRNTNDPASPGTMVVPNDQAPAVLPGSITGIAARKGFSVISIEKVGMNKEVGFGLKVLSALQEHDIGWEHMPSGIENLSIVVYGPALQGKEDALLADIAARANPDWLEIHQNAIALICLVGRGMHDTPGVLATLTGALAAESISIRLIDQGASELSIIVGVQNADCEKAVHAIYKAFSPKY